MIDEHCQFEMEPRPMSCYRYPAGPVMVPGRSVCQPGYGWAHPRSVNAPCGYGYYTPQRVYQAPSCKASCYSCY